jgi:hypothetical protein
MKKERTGGGGGKADPGGDTQPVPVVPSYQEGSVESVGGRPSGKDESDRSGDGTLPAEGPSRPGRGRDAFVSSEVSDKSSVPGKDPRTRS